MNFYAYVYRDPSRDMEPFYVGKGKGDRARRHLSRKDKHPFIQRLQLMKREGIEPDIEIIHAVDEDHAFFLESCLIEVIGRKDLNKGTLLNLTDGGEGPSGQIRSAETRAKISIASKNMSFETRAKISAASKGKKGKPKSLEVRAKISKSKKGKTLSSETRAKMSASRKGKPRSPETRAKLSAAGRNISPETRAKRSEAAKKRAPPSPETRAKISATLRLRTSLK